MEIPSHIELRTDWYFDTIRGKQIHPDQLQGYIARHRYDGFGVPTDKPVKVKKAKAKPVPKPPVEKPAPVKKPTKPKPAAKAKPVKKKAAPKRKRRPAKRII